MTRVAWGVVALLTCACAERRPFWRTQPAADQREAGSVHLSVLAVAPWSHYSDALQPQFNLTADDARREVVRDTASSVESSTEALGLSAGVTEDEGQQGAATGPNVLGGGYFAVSGIGRPDAMTEFWAANALYQEVQLLNRAVRDAAIPSGYRAYLVRLQIALQPSRRNEPYDAYTTLSFFSPERAPDGDAATVQALVHAPEPTSIRSAPESASLLPGNGPCVLPLVATDNLEGSLASRSQADLRRFSLALLGFPGDVAADLQADLFQEQLHAQVAARDLNSLLTIARLSENSLRVRLGAMQQATARYAMVPRNHYVTLLLMVPEQAAPVVDVVARTVLVDTETGVELAGTSDERIRELFDEVRIRHGLPALGDGTLEDLLRTVQQNDQSGYRAALRALLAREPEPTLIHELWLDLVGLMVGSQWSSSRFELPGQGQVQLPQDFYKQTALLIDDGSQRASLVLHGWTFSESIEPSAMLRLFVAGREVFLPAEHVERVESELQLHFPSLQALGLNADPEALAPTLTLTWQDQEATFDVLHLGRSPYTQAPR